MRVLLIEDCLDDGRPTQLALQARGHEVTWILKVMELTPSILQGVLVDAEGRPFREVSTAAGGTQYIDNVVNVDPRTFPVALVDGMLGCGRFSHGHEVVPHLVTAGAFCIGRSSSQKLNERMQQAGARLTIGKDLLVQKLQDGTVELDNLVLAS